MRNANTERPRTSQLDQRRRMTEPCAERLLDQNMAARASGEGRELEVAADGRCDIQRIDSVAQGSNRIGHARAAVIHLCRSSPSASAASFIAATTSRSELYEESMDPNIAADRKRSRTSGTVAIRGRHHTRTPV